MYTAKLSEPTSTYIWENLSAPTIRGGAVDGFDNHTAAMDEYAIAGVLHMDHLAEMSDADLFEAVLSRSAGELSRALLQGRAETLGNMKNLLARHRTEWQNFLASLSNDSFVRNIALTPIT